MKIIEDIKKAVNNYLEPFKPNQFDPMQRKRLKMDLLGLYALYSLYTINVATANKAIVRAIDTNTPLTYVEANSEQKPTDMEVDELKSKFQYLNGIDIITFSDENNFYKYRKNLSDEIDRLHSEKKFTWDMQVKLGGIKEVLHNATLHYSEEKNKDTKFSEIYYSGDDIYTQTLGDVSFITPEGKNISKLEPTEIISKNSGRLTSKQKTHIRNKNVSHYVIQDSIDDGLVLTKSMTENDGNTYKHDNISPYFNEKSETSQLITGLEQESEYSAPNNVLAKIPEHLRAVLRRDNGITHVIVYNPEKINKDDSYGLLTTVSSKAGANSSGSETSSTKSSGGGGPGTGNPGGN